MCNSRADVCDDLDDEDGEGDGHAGEHADEGEDEVVVSEDGGIRQLVGGGVHPLGGEPLPLHLGERK